MISYVDGEMPDRLTGGKMPGWFADVKMPDRFALLAGEP